MYPEAPESTILVSAPESDSVGARAVYACTYTEKNITNGNFLHSTCGTDGSWSPVSAEDCYPNGMSLNFDDYICKCKVCHLTPEHRCIIFK